MGILLLPDQLYAMTETQTKSDSINQTTADVEALDAAREFLTEQGLTDADLTFTATGVVASYAGRTLGHYTGDRSAFTPGVESAFTAAIRSILLYANPTKLGCLE